MKLSEIFSESDLNEIGIIKSFKSGYQAGYNRVLNRANDNTPYEPTQAQSQEPETPAAPKTDVADTPAQNIANQQALNQKLSKASGTQNLNDYLRGIARHIKSAGTAAEKQDLFKELINYMADRHPTAGTNDPAWTNAVNGALKLIKSEQDNLFVKTRPDGKPYVDAAGNPVPVSQAIKKMQMMSLVNKLKTGQHFESAELAVINALLESVGLTLSDLGVQAILIEGKNSYLIKELVDNSLEELLRLAGR